MVAITCYFSQNCFSVSGLTETRQGEYQNEFIKACAVDCIIPLNPTERTGSCDPI